MSEGEGLLKLLLEKLHLDVKEVNEEVENVNTVLNKFLQDQLDEAEFEKEKARLERGALFQVYKE